MLTWSKDERLSPLENGLTATPNKLVATINHERMPVLLTREQEVRDLVGGSPEEAFALTPCCAATCSKRPAFC